MGPNVPSKAMEDYIPLHAGNFFNTKNLVFCGGEALTTSKAHILIFADWCRLRTGARYGIFGSTGNGMIYKYLLVF